MRDDQEKTIRFAYLDLVGIRDALDNGEAHIIDTSTINQTIEDIQNSFQPQVEDIIEERKANEEMES